MGLFEDQQARQKRTEEFIKARDMTQGQVVEKLLKAEPELKSKGYSVNLSTYLKENKINPKEIKDTSWMRPVKQTELREKLSERFNISSRKITTRNKVFQLMQMIHDSRFMLIHLNGITSRQKHKQNKMIFCLQAQQVNKS